MKSYKEYLHENSLISETLSYIPEIDGPPLLPKHIHGAEVQIKNLAGNIRTTFGLDERYAKFKMQINKAADLLDEAANLIGNVMSSEERMQPHKFHKDF